MRRLIAVVVLTLTALLFFHAVLWGGQTFFFMDLTSTEFPQQFWMKAHPMSQWNPLLFIGEPQHANLQRYAFEPLRWLSLRFEPLWGFNAWIVAHFWLASLGVFFLFLRLTFSTAASLIGALIFTYGGYVISLGHLPIVLASVTYLPWTVLTFAAALQSTTRRVMAGWGAACALSLTAQWFGGEPQIVVITLTCLAVAAAMHREKSYRSRILLLIFVTAASCAAAAVQLLPFLEFLQHTNRQSALSWEQATRWSLEPSTLASLLVPHHFINPAKSDAWGLGYWEKELPYIVSIYLGCLALVGCLWSVTLRRTRSRSWLFLLWGAVLLGAALALGKYSPLYALLSHMPGFQAFRFPEKYWLFSHLALCALAVMGWQSILEYEWQKPRRLMVIAGGFTVALLGWMMCADAVVKHLPDGFFRVFLPQQLALVLLFGAAISAALLLPRGTKRACGCIAILCAELYCAHAQVNPTVPVPLLTKTPEAVQTLTRLHTTTSPQNSDWQRIMVIAPQESRLKRVENLPAHYRLIREQLQPPIGLQFNFNDLNAWYSLHLDSYEGFARAYSQHPEKTLNLFGAQWVTSPQPLQAAYLVERSKADAATPLFLYENPGALPLIQPVFQWETASTQEARALRLWQNDFNPAIQAIVNSAPETAAASPTRADSAITSLKIQTDRIALKTNLPAPAIIIHRQAFYPGWKALVDGRPADLLEANVFFQGVFVPSGVHNVVFSYQPRWLRLGSQISSLTMTVLLILALTAIWTARKSDINHE